VHAEPAHEVTKDPFVPRASWKPGDISAEAYACAMDEKDDFSGKKVRLIDKSVEPGTPREKHDWRSRSDDPSEMIRQVKTNLRYWYAEGYGSEKRKKPA